VEGPARLTAKEAVRPLGNSGISKRIDSDEAKRRKYAPEQGTDRWMVTGTELDGSVKRDPVSSIDVLLSYGPVRSVVFEVHSRDLEQTGRRRGGCVQRR
jgi:hypothetical protein